MEKEPDDVSNIHNRFSLTLINPSSHYFSLTASVIIATVTTVTAYFAYMDGYVEEVWFRVPLVVAVLVLTQLLDTRFTRKKEYSKSLHSSLFANLLWVVTLLSGVAAGIVLSKESSPMFITFGMLLFASFRIGIYTTTLGVSLRRAWMICLVQPLAMFLVMVPDVLWAPMLTDPVPIGYGVAFMAIASMWSFMTDRAGRPGMQSTHKTIQAYIASQGNDFDDAEEILEQRSSEVKVSTSQLKLRHPNGGHEFRMVLPDIHPGPYHPVGGSNIPYLIYKSMHSSAMVMHSISDHALNLPSKNEVENYLRHLEDSKVKEEGMQCTEPVTVQINRARVIGLRFGDNPLLFLSLSPHGMEDIPNYMKREIEQYARNRGCGQIMIVDCHNAMGSEISREDAEDMLKAVKSCLDTLIKKDSFPIEYGYANSDGMDVWAEDLGMGGLGVVCLRINGTAYYIAWADANNMENGLREDIVEMFRRDGRTLLEICTSDTHFQQVKVRNKNGYYHLGVVTKADDLGRWLAVIAGKARTSARAARYEILENEARVRVMGRGIFEDYSRALDNALKITKGFLVGGVALFMTLLFW